MATNPKPLLGHPGWWKVGNHIIILIPWVKIQVIASTCPHRSISMDGSFGCNSGGPRGVDKGADIIRFAGIHILLKQPGGLFLVFSPLSLNLPISHQNRIIIVGQSFIVPVDNLLKQGKLVLDLQKLINLLLILDDSEFGIGILRNVSY